MIDYRDLRIGSVVTINAGSHESMEFIVTGIFSMLSKIDDVTLYLDFPGNEGDVFEVEIRDIKRIIKQ